MTAGQPAGRKIHLCIRCHTLAVLYIHYVIRPFPQHIWLTSAGSESRPATRSTMRGYCSLLSS